MEKRTIPLTSVETLSYYILADDFLFFKLLKKKKVWGVESGGSISQNRVIWM